MTKNQIQAVDAHDSLHLDQLHGVQQTGNRDALPDLIDNTDHYNMEQANVDDPPQVMEVDSTQSDSYVGQENKVRKGESDSYDHQTEQHSRFNITQNFNIDDVINTFRNEFNKMDEIDAGEQRAFRYPFLKKSHFINSLQPNDQRDNSMRIQRFLHFLHEFGTEDAHFYLKGLLANSAHSELYYKLENVHNFIAAMVDDLISSYEYVRMGDHYSSIANNRDLDATLASVEKIDTSLWCLKMYKQGCSDLYQKGFKSKDFPLEDLHSVLEEVLRLSTEVITSHIESTNEERVLFKRLGSYKNIFVYLSRYIDSRQPQDWSDESEYSAMKVIEQVG